jgi:hypothetical protein
MRIRGTAMGSRAGGNHLGHSGYDAVWKRGEVLECNRSSCHDSMTILIGDKAPASSSKYSIESRYRAIKR